MKSVVLRAMFLVAGLIILSMPLAAQTNPALFRPANLTEKAPDLFKADFELGNKSHFVVEVHRDWAPNGADRFYNLVKNGFYDGVRFTRVIPGFMVQFGVNGNPSVSSAWRNTQFKDDPVKQSNKRGYITFATAGPNTRTTQLFINFADNSRLDATGFAAFGQVISGMDVVDKINSEYRDRPNPQLMGTQGNAYLVKEFPKLDFIQKATIVK